MKAISYLLGLSVFISLPSISSASNFALSVSPSTIEPGGTIHVTVQALVSGAMTVGDLMVQEGGTSSNVPSIQGINIEIPASTSFNIPSDLPLGQYHVLLVPNDGETPIPASFTVGFPPPPPPPPVSTQGSGGGGSGGTGSGGGGNSGTGSGGSGNSGTGSGGSGSSGTGSGGGGNGGTGSGSSGAGGSSSGNGGNGGNNSGSSGGSVEGGGIASENASPTPTEITNVNTPPSTSPTSSGGNDGGSTGNSAGTSIIGSSIQSIHPAVEASAIGVIPISSSGTTATVSGITTTGDNIVATIIGGTISTIGITSPSSSGTSSISSITSTPAANSTGKPSLQVKYIIAIIIGVILLILIIASLLICRRKRPLGLLSRLNGNRSESTPTPFPGALTQLEQQEYPTDVKRMTLYSTVPGDFEMGSVSSILSTHKLPDTRVEETEAEMDDSLSYMTELPPYRKSDVPVIPPVHPIPPVPPIPPIV